MGRATQTADQRVRSGRLDATTVTVDRPNTEIRGPNGEMFSLPRRAADSEGLVVYRKVNSGQVNPATGQRLRPGQRALQSSGKPLSFGAVAMAAFIGFRVFQLARRCFRKQQPSHTLLQEQLLLQQQQLQQQQLQQQLPPVHVLPAMLQRVLPQLGPPSRVKRIAQQHRNRQRRLPTAQQKMQQRGVAQRKITTLEKWDKAVQQQVHALVVQQQQGSIGGACGRESAALLPLPGLPVVSSMLPPQPLLEVAEVKQQQQQQGGTC